MSDQQHTTGSTQSAGNASTPGGGGSVSERDLWLTVRIPILIGVCVGIALVTSIFYYCMRRADGRRNRKGSRKRKTSESISATDDSSRRSRRALNSQRSRSLPADMQDCGRSPHRPKRERRERTRTEPCPIIEHLTPLPTLPRPARSPRRKDRKNRLRSMPVIPTVPSLQVLLDDCEDTVHPYYNQFPPVADPVGCRVYYNSNNTSTTTSSSSWRSRSKDTSGSSEASHPSMTPLLSPGAGNDDVFSENYFDFSRRVDRDGYEVPRNKINAASADVIGGTRGNERGNNSDARESFGYVPAENQGEKRGGMTSLGESAGNEEMVAPPACSSCELRLDFGSYLVSPRYKQDSTPSSATV